MTDIASLQIRVQSLEAVTAEKRLGKLSKTGNRAEKATDGLTSSFGRLLGPLAAVVSVTAGLSKLVSVTREFDVLNAQLITATGSAEGASIAFAKIEDFAATTPFDLQQATRAFTDLVNRGLTPSEQALKSYGDTASALGFSLSDMVLAVSNATAGEFENLKKFGIRSKKEGDNVTFTFRGVEQTVRNTTEAIEGYFIALGEENFAGAMIERSKTLDGAISNLGDSWDTLFRTISEQGIGDVMTEGVFTAIDVIDELTAMLGSGEIEARIDAITGKFDVFGERIIRTFDIISSSIDVSTGGWEKDVLEFLSIFDGAFTNMPENVAFIMGAIGTEVAVLLDYASLYGEGFVNILVAEFDSLIDKAKVYGIALGDAMNPFSYNTFDLDAELAKIDARTDSTYKNIEAGERRIAQARQDSLQALADERQQSISGYDEEIRKAKALTDEAIKLRDERRNNPEDVLKQFGVGATATGPTDEETKAAEKAAKAAEKLREAREKELENLRLSLRTEEEVISESYAKRLDIILTNTQDGTEKQQDLLKRLNESFADEVIGPLATPDSYEEQLAQIEEFYLARKELILENVNLTEEERTQLELELTAQRNERIAQLEDARNTAILQGSGELFGQLAGLAKNYGGEQSKLYQTLFAASKAFAIAESVIKIQQGIAQAASLPFPANLGAMATVASSTAGIVSTIQGSNYSGNKDAGGIIPQGRVGLVGEFGPELVNGPANVTSRRATAEKLDKASQSDNTPVQPPGNNILVVQETSEEDIRSFLGSDEASDMILEVLQRNPEALKSATA
jgi:hypothetical protein